MSIYYEINQRLADREFNGYTNFVQHDVDDFNDLKYNRRAMQCADRVWGEYNSRIRYIKYRDKWPFPEVDLEEFIWIKLKSKELVK